MGRGMGTQALLRAFVLGYNASMDVKIMKVIERLERFMGTVDDALAIPREAAEFTYALLLSRNAGRAVEIGTSYGYSGLWIGAAVARNGGKLITIDHDSRKADEARSNFAAAGLQDHIETRTGGALSLLAGIDGPIDFVLNDADKENCRKYVELLAPKLSDRAIVLTDNTSTHAAELAGFRSWIKKRPDFVSATLPIGNGMEMSVKVG